jgi:predicted Zn-dependent protease
MALEPQDLFIEADRLLRAGRWKEASVRINHALIASPDWPAGLREAGGLAIRLEGPARAIIRLRRAVRRAPGDPRSWFLLARARYLARAPDKAGAAARRAVLLEPVHLEAWSLVAAREAHHGNFERADRILARSRCVGPPSLADLQVRCHACLSMGHLSRADEIARSILVRAPADPTAGAALGRVWHRLRDPDATWRYVRRLGVLKVGDPDTLTAMSRAALAGGAVVRAEALARRALVAGAGSGEAYLDLARPLWRREDGPGAEKTIERAVMIDPAMRLRGRVLRVTVTPSDFALAFQRNSVSTPV